LASRLRDQPGSGRSRFRLIALQLYTGLELLTAAPTAAERASLEHQLVACFAVSERLSVARYARLAHERIDALLAEGATPIVVGGTGLYLRAALGNLELAPPPPPGCARGAG